MSSHKTLFFSIKPEDKNNVWKVHKKSGEELAQEIETALSEWDRKGYEYVDLKPMEGTLPNSTSVRTIGYFLILRKKHVG
ncbi:MAG: hypothetical protein AAF694_25340 [Bacteroidota bacterium]